MFAEYRFLVFGEKVREVESDLRELIKRGGGFLETFDVAGGVARLHKALTRGQAKESRQLVVVADVKDMKAAVGQDEWKKLVAEVQRYDDAPFSVCLFDYRDFLALDCISLLQIR